MTYGQTTRDFVNCMQVLIVGKTSSTPTLHFWALPSFRTKPTSQSVALTDTLMSSVLSDVLKFRQSTDGEPNNLHPAQPELLLQLLQVLQIAFQETNSGGFQAGFDFVGQPTVSTSIRCSDKARWVQNGNLRIPPVENFGNFPCIKGLDAYDTTSLFLQVLLMYADEEKNRRTLSILEYLASAEAKEENVHLQDDIRISWITVLYASQGNPIPHIAATYQVLGLHPDKVGPAILARREALLGPSPRKQPQPVKEATRAAKAGS